MLKAKFEEDSAAALSPKPAGAERTPTMERFLGRFSPQLYAVLRIVSGFVFLLHGTQKLFGTPAMPAQPGGKAASLPPLLMVAGGIEMVCGLLILLGLLAGWAAFLASGEMAVAYFIQHFPRHPLPVVNQGDPAVLFCFIFLYIASVGSGIWSFDSLFRRPVPPARE
jgi:putative oxidoreductase